MGAGHAAVGGGGRISAEPCRTDGGALTGLGPSEPCMMPRAAVRRMFLTEDYIGCSAAADADSGVRAGGKEKD